MKIKFVIFILCILVPFKASAQLDLLTSSKSCNEIIPKFCEEYNIPDSTKVRLMIIPLSYIDKRDSLKKKFFGSTPNPTIVPGSPFFIEYRELKANRDTQIENLLGKKMTRNLYKYIMKFPSKKSKERYNKK